MNRFQSIARAAGVPGEPVRDEAGKDEGLRAPPLLGAQVSRDELIDEQLREAVARDVDAGGPEDADLAALTSRHAEVERAAAEIEDERQPRGHVRGEGRGHRLLHEADVLEAGKPSRPLEAGAGTLLHL